MKTRQITGVFATEKYLPEARLPGKSKVRLRPDWGDFTRVFIGAVPYLLNHDKAEVVGKVMQAWHAVGEGYRFIADLPVDDENPIERVVNYLREFDQGIRGLFSLGFRITDVQRVGLDDDGYTLYDAAWMLSEISDMTVVEDTDARADAPGEMIALRGFANGWITTEALASITEVEPTEKELSPMGIRECIADLQRQLATGEISDADTLLLHDLQRQLADAFAGVRMMDDEEDGERMEEGEEEAEGEGERAAEDQNREEAEGEGERAAEDQNREEAAADAERGVQDQPSRPERRRAERENRKAAAADAEHFRAAAQHQRSLPRTNPDGERGLNQVSIHPHGRVPRHDELANLDLGMYFRALSDPNHFRVAAKRELAWMDRNLGHGFQRSIDDGAYIPFVLLAEHGPNAKAKASQRALAGVSPEKHLESFMPLAEETYRKLQEHLNGYSERTLTTATTSAGAATSSITDIARSIMWLTEQDRALEMLTVLPGLEGQWQGFYGNANPVADWVAEGGNITETTPTLAQVTRLPKTMGMYWSISNDEMRSADTPIASMIEEGSEMVFRTQAMRAFLSGNDVGTAFANDANAIDGLMNSGITESDFGAAIANLDRDDIVDARRRLFGNEVNMMELGWILSNTVATKLEKTLRGGASSTEYVYQNGMLDSGAEWLPARDSVHLGKTGTTHPSVLLQRSAAIALIWGAGIAFNALQLPGRTKVEYDLQIQCNFAMMNPKRATVLKQT